MRNYIFIGKNQFEFEHGEKYKMRIGKIGTGYKMTVLSKSNRGFFTYSSMEALLMHWQRTQIKIKL